MTTWPESVPLEVAAWSADVPWQPIETAPRNWEILGRTRDGRVRIFTWNKDEYNRKPRPYWDSHGSLGKTWDRERQPVEWVPVPVSRSDGVSANPKEDGK